MRLLPLSFGETSLLGDSESTKHYREPLRRPYEAWGEITGRPILLRSGHHRLELSGVHEADGVWNIRADFGRGCQFLEGLGKLLNCWWITGNKERPYCGFRGTEVQIHDPTGMIALWGHYPFAGNFGDAFRDLLRKPNKAAAGLRWKQLCE